LIKTIGICADLKNTLASSLALVVIYSLYWSRGVGKSEFEVSMSSSTKKVLTFYQCGG
jgi:hypothetical protein